MSKHTPGPWMLSWTRNCKRVFVQGRDTGAFYSIAEVSGPSNKDNESINIKIANIRLIVAAPELLEACKLAREEFAKRLMAESFVIKLDKAISKAEKGA